MWIYSGTMTRFFSKLKFENFFFIIWFFRAFCFCFCSSKSLIWMFVCVCNLEICHLDAKNAAENFRKLPGNKTTTEKFFHHLSNRHLYLLCQTLSIWILIFSFFTFQKKHKSRIISFHFFIYFIIKKKQVRRKKIENF